MSDLISRSDVLTLLYRIFDKYHMSTDKTTELRGFGTDVFKEIREMPTAYDIDNVVEELESNSFITVKQEEAQTKRKDIQSYIAVEKEVVLLKDAIEIVKHGGVSDDVCEWECKYINERYFYQTGCGRIFEYELDSKICLFCGRKLRMVEE